MFPQIQSEYVKRDLKAVSRLVSDQFGEQLIWRAVTHSIVDPYSFQIFLGKFSTLFQIQR